MQIERPLDDCEIAVGDEVAPGLYRPGPAAPLADDPPECRACGGWCCREFTLPGGEAAAAYVKRHHPYFLPRPGMSGVYWCIHFAYGKCERYASRPFICRDFPADGEITVTAATRCALIERIWHERYGDQHLEECDEDD